ncbi:MAG: hypothetical protein JNM00_03675 [Flavobacteriales bacterium]|nr:hypothetical protein [Flavobacteriales bacterium]
MHNWRIILFWSIGSALTANTSLPAQLLTVEGTTVTTSAGATVVVNGGVQLNSGASMNNNGTLSLTGNFQNNSSSSCFGTSNGIVLFNGTSQDIDGTFATSFYHVDTQNSGVIQLLQDISTGNNGVLQSGVFNIGDKEVLLNTHQLTIGNPASSAIIRNSGYLVSETDPLTGLGTVTWQVGNPSSGTYTIPFGNDLTDDYLPVMLQFTGAGISNGSFSLATYPTDVFQNPNNRPLPSGLLTLEDNAGNENATNVVDRWWNITTSGYALDPTANLTLSYRDAEANTGNNTINEATLQAQHFDGLMWSNPPTGISDPAQDFVFVSAVNNWDYAWALVNSSMPLPIELLSFDVEAENNSQVLCQWATASELNCDYFTIERSIDTLNWEWVGDMDATGSVNGANYHLTDFKPYKGISYYRLRQVDVNSTTSYAPIRAVNILTNEAFEINLYPNPCGASTQCRMCINAPSKVHYQIYDGPGRVVLDGYWNHPGDGCAVLPIPMETLSNGSYIFKYRMGDLMGSLQLVKSQ